MKKFKQSYSDEQGAVAIVEAALVYPVVIFVVIILFLLGNVFYQQSKVDALAVRAAEKLAAFYTNPMLNTGIPTNAEDLELNPYRYLFGNDSAEKAVKSYINSELSRAGTGAFKGMEISGRATICEVENYVLYHVAKVKIIYSIEFKPLALLGGVSVLRYSTGEATSADSPSEFIRNIDMILDYADSTGLSQKIKNTLDQFFG